MRKQGPMILGVVAGIIMIFSRYIFIGRNLGWDGTWNTWFLVSTAVASGLGVINLTRIHWKNIERRTNIIPSAVLLIALLGYSILGVGWTVASGPARWIYEVGNLGVTMALFSLLAFFIFSAAYRAFRVKSLESTTLLVVAIIGMLGTAPIGAGALVFCLIGYAAGSIQESTFSEGWLVPLVIVFFASLTAEAAYVLVLAIVGEGSFSIVPLLGRAFPAALYNSGLAVLVYPWVARFLRREKPMTTFRRIA